MVPLLLLLVLLFLTCIIAEPQKESAPTGIKSRVLDSLHQISHALNRHQNFSIRCLEFSSLCSCLASILILPQFAERITERSFSLFVMPPLFHTDWGSTVLLGLLLILHVAGETCLAISERQQNHDAMLCLNSYFWLPLLFAWVAMAYYLPLDTGQASSNSVTSLWLVLLQPLGSLAVVLSLLGPYLLIRTTKSITENAFHYWIRDLRMLISLLIIVLTIVGSRTCFSVSEVQNTHVDIIRIVALPILFTVLLFLVIRLKHSLYAQGGVVAEHIWKLSLWLSLISMTASLIAFHILGMSDPMMHLLLNFSLLAIWGGFILPKFPIKLSTTIQE